MTDANNRDEFPTRRESDLLLQQVTASTEERLNSHRREHEAEAVALDLAMAHTKLIQDQHNIAHEAAHTAHAEKHGAEDLAVSTALRAVATERQIHATAHEKEHEGHQREHGLNNLAIDKAEAATDKRFGVANGYREQINEMVRHLASRESVEALSKDHDRRFEDFRKEREARLDGIRHQIEILEKGVVKAEGRGLGQGAVVAYIVTAVGLVGGILAILIILSNVLTTSA